MNFHERQKKFGTHGESLLCDRYRELYWQHNEYQIIGNDHALDLAASIARDMAYIVHTLGYTPSA
jgi:hypothetical protein